MDEIDELRDQLHRVELALERLSGRVEGMIGLKSTEHEHMREQIAEVDHKRKTTDVTMKALHDRLDEFPAPGKVQETVDGFTALKNRLAGAVAAGMALGIGGGISLGQLIGA